MTVADDVFIGPGVVFTDDPHPPCPQFEECHRGVTVQRRAKIGGGAVLLPGVTARERALVGAGAVVTRDVPPHSVVAGNPAVVIKQIEDLQCLVDAPHPAYEWED